jgi:nucleoside-diphosphate-sugar epimerase
MSDLHVVFGAGGGAGGALVRALTARGRTVRAVTRSGVDLPAVDDVRADATDPEAALRAAEGATVVYHCVNVPYAEWDEKLPRIMDNLVSAAARAGATLVYADNLYMYGLPSGAMAESTPEAAVSRKGILRSRLGARLLERHHSGEIKATIGRASDFFGPGATNTVAGQLVFPAVVAGGKPRWLGSLDQPHSLNYIEDVASALITLGTDERAVGSVWHLPPQPPLTAREFIAAVHEVAGGPRKVGVYPRWMVRIAGLFDGQMKELLEVMYQFEHPFVLDSSRFEMIFGAGPTPLKDAIAETIRWQRAREAPAAGGKSA